MSLYWTSYWALEETHFAAAGFFRELSRHLPETTSLYIEGTSIADDVIQVLLSHAQAGPYLPSPEKYPKSPGALKTHCFRCEFSTSLLADMACLADMHAEPEICDNLFAYVNNEPILEFYDFPTNEIWMPLKVTEERVSAFASALNVAYKRETNV